MTLCWPRPAAGLPPGQRLLQAMPRFTDRPHLPPPAMPAEPRLTISVEGSTVADLDAGALAALGPTEHRADFHCVTTWSVIGLTWTGLRLRDVLASVGITAPPAPYALAKSGDRRRGNFLWEDLVGDDVLVATHLDGELLDDRHGGPLRLVAPQLYGYKSIKYLLGIDFRAAASRRLGKEHLRGRVALEERHPKLPSWVVKLPYRLLIPPTAFLAERTLRRHRARARQSG